jgi:hypothetical protein
MENEQGPQKSSEMKVKKPLQISVTRERALVKRKKKQLV